MEGFVGFDRHSARYACQKRRVADLRDRIRKVFVFLICGVRLMEVGDH